MRLDVTDMLLKTWLIHNCDITLKEVGKEVLFLRLMEHWLTLECLTAEFWACMRRMCSQVCFYSTCPLSSAPFLSGSLFPSFLLLCPSVWAFQSISPHYTHTQSHMTIQMISPGFYITTVSQAWRQGHTTWGLLYFSDWKEIAFGGVWWDPLSLKSH